MLREHGIVKVALPAACLSTLLKSLKTRRYLFLRSGLHSLDFQQDQGRRIRPKAIDYDPLLHGAQPGQLSFRQLAGRGDAFFTRLDGEWWTRFSGGPAAPAPRSFLRRAAPHSPTSAGYARGGAESSTI